MTHLIPLITIILVTALVALITAMGPSRSALPPQERGVVGEQLTPPAPRYSDDRARQPPLKWSVALPWSQPEDALNVVLPRMSIAPSVPLGFDDEGNWTGRPDWATMERLHPGICELPRFAEHCAASPRGGVR